MMTRSHISLLSVLFYSPSYFWVSRLPEAWCMWIRFHGVTGGYSVTVFCSDDVYNFTWLEIYPQAHACTHILKLVKTSGSMFLK